jgi:hypothetical protein
MLLAKNGDLYKKMIKELFSKPVNQKRDIDELDKHSYNLTIILVTPN